MTIEHWHAGIDSTGLEVDATDPYEEFDSAVDALAGMIEGIGTSRAARKAEEIREQCDAEDNYSWRFDHQKWTIFACSNPECDVR